MQSRDLVLSYLYLCRAAGGQLEKSHDLPSRTTHPQIPRSFHVIDLAPLSILLTSSTSPCSSVSWRCSPSALAFCRRSSATSLIFRHCIPNAKGRLLITRVILLRWQSGLNHRSIASSIPAPQLRSLVTRGSKWMGMYVRSSRNNGSTRIRTHFGFAKASRISKRRLEFCLRDI